MTLIDDTLTTAGELGRAAASHANDAATLAGGGISDVAHLGQTALDELGDAVSGSKRSLGRRLVVLAIVAAIAGLVIWRTRSDRHESE